MVSNHDVDHIEHLYATGQKVKAIYACRDLAMVALPNHLANLESFCEKLRCEALHFYVLPRHQIEIEAILDRWKPLENENAVMALKQCAKWIIGVPDTHTVISRKGISQPIVLATRDDFAFSAFISLRKLALEHAATQPAPKANSGTGAEWSGKRLVAERAVLTAKGIKTPTKALVDMSGLSDREIRRRIESHASKTSSVKSSGTALQVNVWGMQGGQSRKKSPA